MPALTTAFLPALPSLQLHVFAYCQRFSLSPPYRPPTRPFSQSQRQFTIQCSASGQSKTHLPPQGGAPVSPLLWRSSLIPASVKSQSLCGHSIRPRPPVLLSQSIPSAPSIRGLPSFNSQLSPFFLPWSLLCNGSNALRIKG